MKTKNKKENKTIYSTRKSSSLQIKIPVQNKIKDKRNPPPEDRQIDR